MINDAGQSAIAISCVAFCSPQIVSHWERCSRLLACLLCTLQLGAISRRLHWSTD